MGTNKVRTDAPLAVGVEEDRSAVTLRAVGELDIDSAAALEQSLLHALEGGAPSIVLDLTGVHFIDAAGLRLAMWAADRSQREDGGRLRIDYGSGAVQRLLGVTVVAESRQGASS